MRNYLELYAKFLKEFLQPKTRIKIIFDCSDGTAALVLKPLLNKNKLVDYEFLNSKPDGRFPAHGPNPLSPKTKKRLIQKVKLAKADLGVIFDADGDRSLFIDNKGREIRPDAIARLLITRLRPKVVVVDTPTGWLVRIPGEDLRYKVVDSPVGGYYLNRIMRKKSADLGVEHSGHYYFKIFYFSDSGILSSIIVMNAVSEMKSTGKNLNQWIDLLPKFYGMPEKSYETENPVALLKRLTRYLRKKKGKLSLRDGVTVRNRDFWINVRRSRTEPLIRLNMEAKSKAILNKELRNIERVLRKR